MVPPPPRSTLFPYTTLFRSHEVAGQDRLVDEQARVLLTGREEHGDRKSTRLNSSHITISYAVFCLKKKKTTQAIHRTPAACQPAIRHPEIAPISCPASSRYV